MPISEYQAQELCNDVVYSLVNWPSLLAALQSGGLEVKGSALISSALDKLAHQCKLINLKEYEDADFVFIKPNSILTAIVDVEIVIEVKFNYARQIGRIQTRLHAAAKQARRYQKAVNASEAYVLYFVAAPQIEKLPPDPRDNGWRYWNSPIKDANNALRKSVDEERIQIVGFAVSELGVPIFCSLIKCNK